MDNISTLQLNIDIRSQEEMIEINKKIEELASKNHELLCNMIQGIQKEEFLYFDSRMKIPNFAKLQLDILERGCKESFLICLDIKTLRKFNDIYGRETVDSLLINIKDWFVNMHFSNSKFYRIGGDEFVLMVNGTNMDKIYELIKLIKERFDKAWTVIRESGNKQNIFFDITIGVINLEEMGEEFNNLNSIIDQIMEVAGKDGTVIVYNKEFSQNYISHLRTELSLKNCIRENMAGFSVYYQPICNHITGLWAGFEALCRWISPDIGVVSPKIFIDEAEQLGLIGEIDTWVLEQSLKQMKIWDIDKHPQFLLHVNISPTELNDIAIVQKIQGILERYDFPPWKLCLEVTKAEDIHLNEHILKTLKELKALGILLALDEFGTDFASLAILKDLPIKTLKLDRKFLKNIGKDHYLKHVLHVMVELVHSAGMVVIAEEVESEDEMLFLASCGVDRLQGNLFFEPQPAAEIEKGLHHFYSTNNTFIKRNKCNIDLKILEAPDGGYSLSPSMYQVLNRCMQKLLYSNDAQDAINDVLKIIGEFLNVSRSYIFELDIGRGTYSNTYEWCDKGIASIKDNLQNIHIPKPWIDTLENNGLIITSESLLLKTGVTKDIPIQKILSILVIPTWDGNILSGFVGFDECDIKYRVWTAEEVQMLYHLRRLLTTTVKLASEHREIRQELQILKGLLDQIRLPIYVSDLETHEIVFANLEFKHLYDNYDYKQIEEHWETINNSENQIDFYRVPQMDANNSELTCREVYNPQFNKYFRNYDGVITWTNNQKMRLQYSVDITTIKEYQRKLEYYAHLDVPTNTLNRRALLEHLEVFVNKMKDSNEPLSICFIDLDGLKLVNDTFGHAEGDVMILRIIESIKSITRHDDIIGRYGGDEFIIILPGCTKELADRRLHKAQLKLSQINKNEEYKYFYSFSYGIAELSEIHSDTNLTAKLIELADIRMFEFKKGKNYKELLKSIN